MKTVVLATFVGSSMAFLSARPARMSSCVMCETNQQTVTDLNLEEMFETFEAADAEVSPHTHICLEVSSNYI